MPALDLGDQELLTKVVTRLSSLENRILALEDQSGLITQRLTGQELRIQDIQDQVLAAYRADTSTVLAVVAATADLSPPPLVSPHARRADGLSVLLPLARAHTWLAIQGGAGTGKTQLAILLVQELGGALGWLRFRDLSGPEACVRLESSIAALAGDHVSLSRPNRFREVVQVLPQGSAIVLDDLPPLPRTPELSQRLLQFAIGCKERGIRIISTSVYSIPPEIARQPEAGAHEVPVPPFSGQDIRDILVAYEAPVKMTAPSYVQFVAMFTHRHAALVASAVRFLKENQWRFSDNEFQNILGGEHARDLAGSILAGLMNTIPDAAARDLLYRLNLVMGDFGMEEIDIVAEAQPALERPNERLSYLVGPYVQHEAAGLMSISPLVRQLGTRDVAPTIRSAIQIGLGEALVRKGHIDQHQAFKAVAYLHAGGATNRAGVLLVIALHGLNEYGISDWDGGLGLLWSCQSLPDTMDLATRIWIRVEQVLLFSRKGDPEYAILDLLLLMRSATQREGWAALLAIGATTHVVAARDPIIATQILTIGFGLLPGATLFNGAPLPSIPGMSIEEVIWFIPPVTNRPEHVLAWLDLVESLSPEQRSRAFGGRSAEDGCKLVSNRCWLIEANKSVDERDWSVILQLTQTVADRARSLGLNTLWACAVKSQIVILAEYMSRFQDARVLAESALGQVGEDQEARFLIEECLGREYVYAGQNETGLDLLESALAGQTKGFAGDRVFALLSAGTAAATSDRQRALQYCQRAVELAKSVPSIPDVSVVQALGEVGLAHWSLGDKLSAYRAMAEAVERLLRCKSDSDSWKDCACVLGYTVGYMGFTSHGTLSLDQTEAGTPHAAPTQGFLLTHNKARVQIYKDERDCSMYASLMLLAEALGRSDEAIEWASRGFDAAQGCGADLIMGFVGHRLAARLASNGRFEEALAMAMDSAAITIACKKRGDHEGHLGDKVNAEAELGRKPSQDWWNVESLASHVAIIPAVFHLARQSTNGSGAGAEDAANLVRACQQVAAVSICPDYWQRIAHAVDLCFVRGVPGEQAIGMGNEKPWNEDFPLRAVTYMGASIQPNADLRNAFHAQTAVLPYVFKQLMAVPVVLTDVVIPFVCEYWSGAFARERFRFRSPRAVEHDLAGALARPPGERAQAVLSVILDALHFTPGPGVQNWLRNSTQTAT